jgi:hypothetical protein
MKPSHILVATGGITTPRIQHAFFEAATSGTEARVNREAERVAATLAKAGYFQFSLHALADDGTFAELASYRVETLEPVVSARFVAVGFGEAVGTAPRTLAERWKEQDAAKRATPAILASQFDTPE